MLPEYSELPYTARLPVSSKVSALNSRTSPLAVSIVPEPDTANEPVSTTLPELLAPVVMADCIVSDPLPDFLRYTLPSGTFIASSPGDRDAVVGIDPVTRLLFCSIGMV